MAIDLAPGPNPNTFVSGVSFCSNTHFALKLNLRKFLRHAIKWLLSGTCEQEIMYNTLRVMSLISILLNIIQVGMPLEQDLMILHADFLIW